MRLECPAFVSAALYSKGAGPPRESSDKVLLQLQPQNSCSVFGGEEMMTHCVVPGVSQYKCRECGWELMITETDHAPQGATGGSDESAEWCTGYRHRPWPPRGCDRCGGEMRPWREAKISRRRPTRGTFYSCPGCGREKVNRDDP